MVENIVQKFDSIMVVMYKSPLRYKYVDLKDIRELTW